MITLKTPAQVAAMGEHDVRRYVMELLIELRKARNTIIELNNSNYVLSSQLSLKIINGCNEIIREIEEEI